MITKNMQILLLRGTYRAAFSVFLRQIRFFALFQKNILTFTATEYIIKKLSAYILCSSAAG